MPILKNVFKLHFSSNGVEIESQQKNIECILFVSSVNFDNRFIDYFYFALAFVLSAAWHALGFLKKLRIVMREGYYIHVLSVFISDKCFFYLGKLLLVEARQANHATLTVLQIYWLLLKLFEFDLMQLLFFARHLANVAPIDTPHKNLFCERLVEHMMSLS